MSSIVFDIDGLGSFTGNEAAAKATCCTVHQFNYRWYKLGFRHKKEFERANDPEGYKKQMIKDKKLVNRALQTWRAMSCHG